MLVYFFRAYSNKPIVGFRNNRYNKADKKAETLVELKNPANYLDKSRYDGLLEKFFLFCKSTWHDKSTDMWANSNEVKDTVNNWKIVIPNLTAEQTCRLVRTLSGLNINDNEAWTKIEKHVQRKILKEVTMENVVDLAKAASKANRTSDSFWNTLESVLISRLYNDTKFSADQLAEIFYSFHVMNKGSIELLVRFNKNLLEVCGDFTQKDLFRMIYISTKQLSLERPTMKALSKRGIALAHELDNTRLQQLFVFFIKYYAEPEQISRLELEILAKMSMMNLMNLSTIVFYYAKFYVNNIHKSSNKDKVLKTIENLLVTQKKSLVENFDGPEKDTLMLKMMWGLASMGYINNMKLWKDYGKELVGNKELSKIDNSLMVRELKNYLMAEGLY